MNDTLVRLQRAIDFVEAGLFDNLPLSAIAGAASCSPWHFHRLFTSLTGETPAGYVRKRRLADICRRLVETQEPVFTHTGHIARFPDMVKQVWGRWLPASRYRHVPAPDFEWYDERWDPETGEGEIDIYVPVADG
jgi:AraC-like DNA-binding protein